MENITIPADERRQEPSNGNPNKSEQLHLLLLILKHRAWKNGALHNLAHSIEQGMPITRENATDLTEKDWNKIISKEKK